MSNILSDVKLALGISHGKKDKEISGCIASAKREMQMAGVRVVDENDEYTATVIKTYCKGIYNYQGEGERYLNLFEKQIAGMSMNSKYNTEADDGIAD